MRVEAGSTNPAEPYDTAENAFATVKAAAIYATNLVAQAAAAAEEEGETESEDQFVEIRVGAGRYAESGIYIGRNVTLRGATGNRDDVVIGPNSVPSNLAKDPETVRVLQATGSRATVADLTITNGYSFSKTASTAVGGGAYLTSGATITNCHITKCLAYRGGDAAGLYVNGANAYDVLVDKCEKIYKTTAIIEDRGYAVYVAGNSIVDRCQIVDNTVNNVKPGGSNTFGGALAVNNSSGSNSKVRNCLIARNAVLSGAQANNSNKYATGVSIRGGYLENCTIVSNRSDVADVNFVALSVYNPTTGNAAEFVQNCHIFDNYNSAILRQWAGNAASLDKLQTRITYSCTSPLSVTSGGKVYNLGTGCVSSEDDTKWEFDEKGRFNLLAGSPCISKGITREWMTGATDLYGNPRIYGKGPEIGAVEFITHGITIIVK